MKNNWFIVIIFLIGWIVGGLIFMPWPGGHSESAAIRRDTLVVRDTVYPPLPEPKIIRIIKYDTARAIDTVNNPADTAVSMLPDSTVVIPLSAAVYETEDYRAVVEGYKPRLAGIELYPKVTVITNTVAVTRRPRWALTGGVGIGYIPGKGIEPYMGVSAGYVFWSK